MNKEKKLTQKQEWFEKQKPERKWIIIEPFLNLFNSAVTEKMKIIPSLSAISATLLIVATLNPDLMPIDIIPAKIIISVLLLLIPFSLIIHVLEMEKTARKALEYCGEYQKKITEEFKKVLEENFWEKFKIKITKSKSWDRFAAEFPISTAIIYLIIIVYLLCVIWK